MIRTWSALKLYFGASDERELIPLIDVEVLNNDAM